jgi:hypothetical protein
MRLRFAVASLLALGIACSGDDESPAPTPTLFPELAASPGPTSVPPPLPTPCTEPDGTIIPCSRVEPSSLAWLVDVRDGSVTQIFEDPVDDNAIRYAGFDGDQAVLGVRESDAGEYRLEVHRYELDGSEVTREPWVQAPDDATDSYHHWRQTWLPGDPICDRVEGGIEIDGAFYAGVDCGPISPDGRQMLYRIDAGEIEQRSRVVLPAWDEWLIDLETGESSELRTGLAQCNADTILGPTWSQSSRYVFFADCSIGGGRIILGDVEKLATRVILEDTPSYRNMPDWSASDDLIVYPDGNGGTTLEDLDEGTTLNLGLPWPARFDTSGRYVYAAAPGSDAANPETVIYDTETFVSTTLPGEALYAQWPVVHTSVGGTDDGYIAVLPGPLYCAGMQIYVDGTPLVCVQGGEAPSFSPDGRYVALTAGSDVVVIDIETGDQQVVVEGVQSNIPYPIPPPWNEDGTHIIVRSPYEYGPTGP